MKTTRKPFDPRKVSEPIGIVRTSEARSICLMLDRFNGVRHMHQEVAGANPCLREIWRVRPHPLSTTQAMLRLF